MGHSYNKNVNTPNKGLIIGWARVAIGASGAVGTIEQGDAGFIESVTKVGAAGTGLYRFKINGNHRPAIEGAILPKVNAVGAAAASGVDAYFRVGTYNATTGEFDITTATKAASPAAADPANGDHIHVVYCFPFYKNL